MAALTWRNVDAPDFRTAMEGLRQSTEMFDSAFNRVDKTIEGVDSDISGRVNTQLQLEILAADTPDKAKAVAANLAMSPDARRITAQTMAAARQRPTELLNEELVGLNVAGEKSDQLFTGKQRGRTEREWAIEQESAPLMVALAGIKGSGKEALAQRTAIMADPQYATARAALAERPKLFEDMVKFGEDRARNTIDMDGLLLGQDSTRLGMDSTRQSMRIASEEATRAATRFNMDLRDDGERRKATQLAEVLGRIGENAGDIEHAINTQPDLTAGLPATVVAAARAQAIANRLALGGGGGSGGGSDIAPMGAGGGQDGAGIGEALISSVLPGARITGTERTEKRNREVKGDPNSWHLMGNGVEAFDMGVGTGAKTFAEAKAKLKAKYGDRLVEAKDESNRPGYAPHWHFAIRTEGMKPPAANGAERAGQLLGLTPDNDRTDSTTTSLEMSRNGDRRYELATFVARGGGKVNDVGKVASNLLSGNFKGEDKDALEYQIRQVQNENPGMPAEVVGRIMDMARNGKHSWLTKPIGANQLNSRFDKALLNQLLQSYSNKPEFMKSVRSARVTDATVKGLGAVRTAEQAAAAEVLRRRTAIASRGRVDLRGPDGRVAQAGQNRRDVTDFGVGVSERLDKELKRPPPKVERAKEVMVTEARRIIRSDDEFRKMMFKSKYKMTPQQALAKAGLG